MINTHLIIYTVWEDDKGQCLSWIFLVFNPPSEEDNKEYSHDNLWYSLMTSHSPQKYSKYLTILTVLHINHVQGTKPGDTNTRS